MRQFWWVQWWGRGAPPHIRYEPVEGVLATGEGQQTEYVAYQHGLGFYGWTLKVTNTGTTAQVVDIEAMQDASGRLLSILVQRTSRADDIGRLEPGQSLRLHLAYLEERP
jgi:hypothetical protein